MIITPLWRYCTAAISSWFLFLGSLARHSLTHSLIHSSTHSSLPILILPSGGSFVFVVVGSFDACVTAAASLRRSTAIRAACSNLVLYQSRSLGCVPVRPSLATA